MYTMITFIIHVNVFPRSRLLLFDLGRTKLFTLLPLRRIVLWWFAVVVVVPSDLCVSPVDLKFA